MRRWSVMQAMENIPDSYILAAHLPNAVVCPSVPAKAPERKGFWARLSGVINSGWTVAAICTLVSVGILAAIIYAGRGEPVIPPLAINETTVSQARSEAVETTTTVGETAVEPVTDEMTVDQTTMDPVTIIETTIIEMTTAEIVAPETEAETASRWNGNVASVFAGGSGTAASPFIIKTADQLALMARRINNGMGRLSYYRLDADIDLANKEWTPIGTYARPFRGSFDGGGHTVSNLKMTTHALSEDGSNRRGAEGLFGYLDGASVKSLRLQSVTLSVPSVAWNDYTYVGALAGRIVVSSGNSTSISQCYVDTVTVKVPKSTGRCYMGGLVGYVKIETNGYFMVEQTETQNTSIAYTGEEVGCFGGLAGFVKMDGVMSLENVCSYASFNYSNKSSNYGGLIGQISTEHGFATFEHVFASIKASRFNGSSTSSEGTGIYWTHVMVGEIVQNEDTLGSFRLVNCYGYVTLEGETDLGAGSLIYTAFDESIFMIDCAESMVLSSKWGFDEDIWILGRSPRLRKGT